MTQVPFEDARLSKKLPKNPENNPSELRVIIFMETKAAFQILHKVFGGWEEIVFMK